MNCLASSCPICGGNDIKIAYKGKIRDGGLGKYTNEAVTMWQCTDCQVIWHDESSHDLNAYYESSEYRNELEETSDIENFYKLHDKETLDKFLYTGTDIFRHKIVCDIGCGGGAFLDFLRGVAQSIVAIEPSEAYRHVMDLKDFITYPYSEMAKADWAEKIDVITSFDVIEHVADPKKFMDDVYDLLAKGGQAIIGTPTDAPIMRELLGDVYEKKQLFSTQHLWVLSEKSLKIIAKSLGFREIEIKYFQRYGFGNMLGWLRQQEPRSDISGEFITRTLDAVWKNECSSYGLADYIVLYVNK